MNNCFAVSGHNRCRILSIKKYPGQGCSFFKTPEQAAESLRIANARLANLDKVHQKHIAEKYYDGTMPWLEDGGGYEC